MVVSESVKANIRAVLLSKTDGKGVFVNTFLKDYKSIIGETLLYKSMGYDTLEAMIKDIPDVCRLQYAEKEMAYRLYGIAKPNTYASSFMKRAEGNSGTVNNSKDSHRRKKTKGDIIDLGTSLEDDWIPNTRGLFSVCFPNRPENNLSTREDVIEKFSMFGDVAEVNIISQLTFVRYRDQVEAKTAIRTLSTILGVRRADERSAKRDRPDRRKQVEPQASSTPIRKISSAANPVYNKPLNNDDDEDWDDTPASTQAQTQNLRVTKSQIQNHQPHSTMSQNPLNQLHSPKPQFQTNQSHNSKSHNQTNRLQSPKVASQPSPHSQKTMAANKQDDIKVSQALDTEKVQLYLGNLPNDIHEDELEEFVSCYNVSGVRLKQKDNGKKFAFVDCVNAAEAQKMIEELGQTHYRGRTLMVGLGNQGAKGSATGTSNNETSNSMKVADHNGNMPDIEKQFQQLTMHRGNERITRTVTNTKAQKGSHYSNDSLSTKSIQSDSMCMSEVPPLESTRLTNGYEEEDMPALEETQVYNGMMQKYQSRTRSTRRDQDDMPPLETAQISPYTMPELEHYRMPELERSQMPELERSLMPKLERSQMPELERSRMPNVESSRIEPVKVQSEAVQLFIGNFPYGTRQEDLVYLLAQYGITNLVMMNRAVTNRSTYAFATCNDMTHAEMAIQQLDQTSFRGRPLTVTLANPVGTQVPSPASTSSGSMPLTPLANITCTVGEGSGRQVHVEESDTSQSRQPQQQYGQRSRYNKGQNQPGNIPFTSKELMVKTDFDPYRMSQKLRDYHAIVVKLRSEERYSQEQGTIMIVNITHVESDKIFFGQMLKDSAMGTNTDIPSLLEISNLLQEDNSKSAPIKGMGRCAARYKGEWFRGWCNHVMMRDGREICDIYYVDYGNKEQVPKEEVYYTNMHMPIWSVAPLARPFKLIEPHFDMESLVGENLVVEVIQPASDSNNFVTTVYGRFGE